MPQQHGEIAPRQARQNVMVLRPVVPARVAIIGAGGIGTYIGQACALAGVKSLTVFDSDTLEESNLNRLPYQHEWIGRRKTACLQDYVIRLMGAFNTEFIARDNVETDDDLWPLDGCEFVFITADRGTARNLVTKYCKAKDIPFINVGYDGNNISFYKSFRSSAEGAEPDAGGYTITPSWAAPTMVIAGLAMYFMAYPRVKHPFSGNIMDLLGCPETHKCPTCGFESPDMWLVEGHVQVCSACRLEFHSPDEYSKHLTQVCQCGAIFCKKRLLTAHIKREGVEHHPRDQATPEGAA
jgi:hypothetical protein